MAVRLRVEPYDPDAIDADGDGIVQEGTAWERPAGTRLISELGSEISRGLTSMSRPNMRVIDRDGQIVKYTPRYGSVSAVRGTPSAPVGRLRTLADMGVTPLSADPRIRSLKDMGIRTVGDIVYGTPSAQPLPPSPMELAQQLEDGLSKQPANMVFRKFLNRDRALRKANLKAQELSFTSGTHYLIETGQQFAIVNEADFVKLQNAYGGDDELRKLATVIRYDKPKPVQVDIEEARQNLKGPVYLDNEVDAEKYIKGVMDIHYNNGSLDDLDDEVFAAVVLDENITDEYGHPMDNQWGDPITFDDIMVGNEQIDEGAVFENRRFRMQSLKNWSNLADGGIWSVFKVTDKETGEEWYIKSSMYGANDGLLENFGMRVGSLLDLAAKPDEKNIRTTKAILTSAQGMRYARWTSMRSIQKWENPEGPQLNWTDAGNAGGINPDKVHLGDLGSIITMDFVFGNSDRHGGNFMVATDDQGRQRLGIIDNGLLFGGRIYENRPNDYEIPADEWEDYTDYFINQTIGDWAIGEKGNQLLNQGEVLNITDRLVNDDTAEEEFTESVKRTVTRLRENLEQLTDPEYYEKRGIPLTMSEKAHLEAVKKIAEARIEMLSSNPYLVSEYITNTPPPTI